MGLHCKFSKLTIDTKVGQPLVPPRPRISINICRDIVKDIINKAIQKVLTP